jgi:hypothetical protein
MTLTLVTSLFFPLVTRPPRTPISVSIGLSYTSTAGALPPAHQVLADTPKQVGNTAASTYSTTVPSFWSRNLSGSCDFSTRALHNHPWLYKKVHLKPNFLWFCQAVLIVFARAYFCNIGVPPRHHLVIFSLSGSCVARSSALRCSSSSPPAGRNHKTCSFRCQLLMA